MLIANRDDMLVIDSSFEYEIGMGPVIYSVDDFMTKFGLVIPLGKQSNCFRDYLDAIQKPEDFGDKSISTNYITPYYLFNVFVMDWKGNAFILHFNGECITKTFMPKGKHWTVASSMEPSENAAFNLVLNEAGEIATNELRNKCQDLTTNRLLKPLVIIKENFLANKPENAMEIHHIKVIIKP